MKIKALCFGVKTDSGSFFRYRLILTADTPPNDVPYCEEYSDLRKQKLSETLYSASVVAAAAVSNDDKIKSTVLKEAIPEFLRFNIVECDVRNIC